jgi:hypothetical protein
MSEADRWRRSALWCAVALLGYVEHAAYATTWVTLKNSDKTVQHAYDRDRLRIDAQVVVFWRRILFLKPQPSPYGEVYKGVYQERIDCQNQTLQTLFIGLYQKDHRILLEKVTPDSLPGMILPESIGELFQSAMCRFVTAPLASPSTAQKNRKVKTPFGQGTFVPRRRPVVIDAPLPLTTPAAPLERSNTDSAFPEAPTPPTAPEPRTPIITPAIVPPLFPSE